MLLENRASRCKVASVDDGRETAKTTMIVELVMVISLDAGRSLAGSGSADANAHSSVSPVARLLLVGTVVTALFEGGC